MLWFQPARDWFNGIAWAPASRPVAPTWPPEPPSRDPLLDLPPPTAPPVYPEPHAVEAAPREVPSARPASVTWACVLTWIFTAAAFALFAVVLVVMIAAPHAFIDEAHRQNPDLAGDGLSDGALRTASLVASGLVMAWSAAAGALAVLTWRRVHWAAVALMVSTGLAGALCLLSIVGSLALLVPLAGCTATVALLLRAESRLWFRS
jgi:hypothetical protein